MDNVDDIIEGDSMFEGDEHEDVDAGGVGDEEGYDMAGSAAIHGNGADADDNEANAADDPELEAIKARVREMEEEAEKIKAMHNEVEKQMVGAGIGSPTAMSAEEKLDADNRSIWIGNVDYLTTAEELESHFHGCGSVNRVTILCDKFTGHPKGFAYIEFGEREAVQTATLLDDSLFRGRQIKVTPKRTNRPGISSTNRPPRGAGRVHRGASRGGGYHGGFFTPRGGYRGRGFRPRRASYYSPY